MFSSIDVLSPIWLSQNLGHSSHSQNWHRPGNRKAYEQRWVMAKSLLASSPVLLCYIKGLETVWIVLLCGMNRSGLWDCGDVPKRVSQTCMHILTLQLLHFGTSCIAEVSFTKQNGTLWDVFHLSLCCSWHQLHCQTFVFLPAVCISKCTSI